MKNAKTHTHTVPSIDAERIDRHVAGSRIAGLCAPSARWAAGMGITARNEEEVLSL